MASCDRCGMEVPTRARICPYCRSEIESSVPGVPKGVVEMLSKDAAVGQEAAIASQAQVETNDNPLFSYAFIVHLYCTVLVDDSSREQHRHYAARSLPCIKAFSAVSYETVAAIMDAARVDLQDISENDHRSLTDTSIDHMSYLNEKGLGQSIFTYLASFVAFCGELDDLQMDILIDLANECDISISDDFKNRLAVMKHLHSV